MVCFTFTGHDYDLELDHFFAHLSAVLTQTVRHVITPSTVNMPGYPTQSPTSNLFVCSSY